MSFNWHQFIELAKYLFDNTEGTDSSPEAEARCRTIVSRSYYAVYHIAREFAEENDGFRSHGNDHQNLQNHFTKSKGHPVRRKIGNQLKRLHQNRKVADYNNVLYEAPHNSANKTLHEAQKILDNLNELKK